MDAQRCANTLKPLKQVFSFRKESKTATLTKSKPCSYVLSCLALFTAKSLKEWQLTFAMSKTVVFVFYFFSLCAFLDPA